MDIKSVLRSSWPFNVNSVQKVDRKTTNETTDREGNGQSQQKEPERRKLSDKEVTELVAYLESLDGVKNNNLKVRLAVNEGVRVIFIEDPSGKVVRRIPDSEFALVSKTKEQKSGNLLNKAM